MNASHRAIGKTQDHFGQVFHVDLQVADSSRLRKYLHHLAHDPAGIIEFVAQFQKHAAAQFLAGTDRLAVVGRGPPVGQVLADLGTKTHHASNAAAVYGVMDGNQRGLETQVVANRQHDIPLPAEID